MARSIPYISFHGNATEMLGYYHSIFGGELNVLTYGDQIDGGAQFPFDAPRDAVAHATLTGVFTVCGGDDLADSSGKLNRGDLSFVLEVDTPEEGEEYISKLTADGGRVVMPFAKAPWGDHYGQIEDKYGMAWHVSTPTGR